MDLEEEYAYHTHTSCVNTWATKHFGSLQRMCWMRSDELTNTEAAYETAKDQIQGIFQTFTFGTKTSPAYKITSSASQLLLQKVDVASIMASMTLN